LALLRWAHRSSPATAPPPDGPGRGRAAGHHRSAPRGGPAI